MTNLKLLRRSLFVAGSVLSLNAGAQSREAFVPCQEMPALIQQFDADQYLLQRFYTPATGNTFRAMGGENNFHSPEKSARLNKLYQEYLARLEKLPFQALSQECKVDYILFRRDVLAKMRELTDKEKEYDRVKQWMPFADRVFALERMRRRGAQLNAEQVAKDWAHIAGEVKAL